MPKQTTLYRYLTGPDDASFCHRVSEALSRGWVLESPMMSGHHGLTSESVSQTCRLEYDVAPKTASHFSASCSGPPTLTYDEKAGRVICGQAIIKDVDRAYEPGLDLSQQ
ncbi:MAG: hypothetical protein ABS59_05330 [Methylobacterium sp. SCN 67-24]|jgi:hypothetical protein|nr:DUF1737 domain-containing protein [Bosea sp. (in: a-proteobacteria)]ODT54790.1 MAG: hypothetical protein ABS59_05330 [Methylobacterium sp. SCN 67-24]